jgi:hypothetical protein
MYSGSGERRVIYECILLKKKGDDAVSFAPAVRPDACYPESIEEIDLKSFIPKIRMKLPLRSFMSLALNRQSKLKSNLAQ